MTAVVNDAPAPSAVRRDVVIFGWPAGGAAVGDGLAGEDWRVWTPATDAADAAAGWPAGTVAAWADLITAVLAAPDSPDRAVLVGHGLAGLAVLEFADEHPERAAAVVAVELPELPELPGLPGLQDLPELPDLPGAGAPLDLACPALVLAAADPYAVGAFLAGLDQLAGQPAACPARLPALTPTLLNDPDVIRQLRELGPVHRINAPGVATSWILTGHAVTTETLADPRLIGEVEITAGFRPAAADPSIPHRGERDLVTIDGREHARLRRLVGRHLTPARVEALRPRMQREADALLDALPTGEAVDLLPAFARPLPIIVLCELFGVPAADRGYIQEWLVERMTSVPPSAHEDVDDYLRALIEQRRRGHRDDLPGRDDMPGREDNQGRDDIPGRDDPPGLEDMPDWDDMLGWIVRAEGDLLSEDDLVSAARLLMVGGHRAPTTLLVNGVAALLGHRRQWQRLVADPALVGPAVEELLRFVTPFPVGLARHTSCPIDVDGVLVPEGDLIAASLVAANRDPRVFDDPDVLDVAREHNGHLAFGHGHHYCLGAALARATAQVAIATLARRFPGMVLAGDLQYRQSRVRYLLELPVVLAPAAR